MLLQAIQTNKKMISQEMRQIKACSSYSYSNSNKKSMPLHQKKTYWMLLCSFLFRQGVAWREKEKETRAKIKLATPITSFPIGFRISHPVKTVSRTIKKNLSERPERERKRVAIFLDTSGESIFACLPPKKKRDGDNT